PLGCRAPASHPALPRRLRRSERHLRLRRQAAARTWPQPWPRRPPPPPVGPDAGLPPRQPIMGPGGGPEPAPGVPMRTPGGMSPVQKRRRDVLIGLLAAVRVKFVLAFMAGSMIFWGLWIVSGLALGGYVFMLLQLKAKTQQRRYAARQP